MGSRSILIMRIFCVSLILIASGCAGKMGSGAMETQADSSITEISGDLAKVNTRMSSIEKELAETRSKLAAMESSLQSNHQEAYLRVMVPVLNIRTSPTTANDNIIAKAEEGAYLRKLGASGNGDEWFRVEFMIDDFPYYGHVLNSENFFKEEIYDPITFNRIYNRKLIQHQWETEVAYELKQNRVKTLGVFISGEDQAKKRRFMTNLAKKLRNHKIYIKELGEFNSTKISDTCTKNKVEAVIAIEMTKDSDTQIGSLDIRLFSRGSIILYSTIVPIQRVELQENLGRR